MMADVELATRRLSGSPSKMFSLTTLSLPLMRKACRSISISSGEAVRSQDGEGKSGHRKVYILRVLTLVAGLAVGLAVSTNCYEVFGGTLHPARSVFGVIFYQFLALLLSAAVCNVPCRCSTDSGYKCYGSNGFGRRCSCG